MKTKIDTVQEVLFRVFKKQLKESEIALLSQAITSGPKKRALRVKLIRRVNANPYLLDQVYRTIHEIVDEGGTNYIEL